MEEPENGKRKTENEGVGGVPKSLSRLLITVSRFPFPVSRVFQNDALENMRYGLALVDAALHVLVDVLPLDDLDRIDLPGEERSDRIVKGDVSLVLELLHPDAV